jgi:hypothetical protein
VHCVRPERLMISNVHSDRVRLWAEKPRAAGGYGRYCQRKHAENMSYIMLLHSDPDQDHREHSARPKENQEAVAVGQGAKCRGLCMSFYPQQSCAVWRVLDLAKHPRVLSKSFVRCGTISSGMRM